MSSAIIIIIIGENEDADIAVGEGLDEWLRFPLGKFGGRWLGFERDG